MMAERYQKRPSEIMDIEDSYLAFSIDEVGLFLETEVTGKDGRRNWSKVKWQDNPVGNNQDFFEFVKKHEG